MDIKTLTGLTLEQVLVKMDEELPADAYTAVPGGADLTDIDPGWMRKILTKIFGICGFGWGYSYDPQDMHIERGLRKMRSGEEQPMAFASLKRLVFWFKLEEKDGLVTHLCNVHASGASDNSNMAYAMKGAITNALGNAASNLGFQESVYLGHRSHKTMTMKKLAASSGKTITPAAGIKPAPGVPVPAGMATVPAKPVPDLDLEDLVPEGQQVAAGNNPANFIIPLGKKTGMKLGECSDAELEYYSRAAVSNTTVAALVEKAKTLIELRQKEKA